MLIKNGFTAARSSPCLFTHHGRGIATLIHGDDFVSTAEDENLRWMKKIIEEAFEISTTIIGPDRHDNKQAKVLNRTITYTEQGIEYESDPRHAELI
eukprot:5158835-Karenia_brevis.AAC.1